MNTYLEIFKSELTHLVRSPFKLVSQSLFVFALVYGCQNGLDLFNKQTKEISIIKKNLSLKFQRKSSFYFDFSASFLKNPLFRRPG